MFESMVIYILGFIIFLGYKLIKSIQNSNNDLTENSYIFDAWRPKTNYEREALWMSKGGRIKNLQHHEQQFLKTKNRRNKPNE